MAFDGGGIPDLSKLRRVPDDVAARAMGAAEVEHGLRCRSCAERIMQGLHVHLLHPTYGETGNVVVQRIRLAFCSRPECEELRAEAIASATYVEPVTFMWVDDLAAEFPEAAPS